MGRRDPIFWAASAIFALALVLGAAVHEGFLLLVAGAYLLRPTVHSLGFAKRLTDERQLLIQYQASNVAFAVLVLGVVTVIVVLMRRGDHAWEMLEMVLVVSLVARGVTTLLLVGDAAVAGAQILLAAGVLVAAFGIAEGGLGDAAVHGLPGALLASLGLLSRRWPKAAGWLVLALIALFGAATAARALAGQPMHWGIWLGAILVVAPLGTAAVCLLRPAHPEDEAVAPSPDP